MKSNIVAIAHQRK